MRTPKDCSNDELFYLLGRDASRSPRYDRTLWVELSIRLARLSEDHPEYKRMRGLPTDVPEARS